MLQLQQPVIDVKLKGDESGSAVYDADFIMKLGGGVQPSSEMLISPYFE